MLPLRQVIIAPDECADKRRKQRGRPTRIHQAKSRLLEKCARVLDRSDGIATEPPLFAPLLLEFEIGHGELRILSCVSRVQDPGIESPLGTHGSKTRFA